MVVCPRVVDPTNLGGIIRNCCAFGATGLLLGPGCADPFSRRVVRVSMVHYNPQDEVDRLIAVLEPALEGRPA